MKAFVLKAFAYAHDHHVTTTQPEGAVVEIDDAVFEGLLDEGFIREATDDEIEGAREGAVVIAPEVEIPADWAGLGKYKLLALATAVNGGDKVTSVVSARALIEAELAQRAAA